MSNVIETHGLSVAFGAKLALNSVDFKLPQGEIVGLVGKNGAGKSTLIRVLSGLIFPTQGYYTIDGVSDPIQLEKQRKGVVSLIESPRFYDTESAETNLMLRAISAGIQGDLKEYVSRQLDYVGLSEVKGTKKKVKAFSLGMKQRLAIAMALTEEPRLMLLDEPTNGLDPEGIAQIRDLLLSLNREKGITILLSTHILPELSRFATSYAFMNKGRLVKQISAKDFEAETAGYITLHVSDSEKAGEILAKEGYHGEVETEFIRLFGLEDLSKPIRLLTLAGIDIYSVKETVADLEEYYLDLLGGDEK